MKPCLRGNDVCEDSCCTSHSKRADKLNDTCIDCGVSLYSDYPTCERIGCLRCAECQASDMETWYQY